MSDPWANRIELNTSQTILETAGDHGISGAGSLDSSGINPGADQGQTAQIVDVTKVKTISAPENPPSTWSADNPYK